MVIAAGSVTSDPSNGTVRCLGCHQSHHQGRLEISGTAPDNIVTRWVHVGDERPNTPADLAVRQRAATEHDRLDDAIIVTQAKDALVGLGWKPAVARAAVEEARAHVGADGPVEELVREALRRCPKPSARTT